MENQYRKRKKGWWVLLLLCMITIFSCQDEFNRLIPESSGVTDSVNLVYGQPKVLLLIADGARGESVRTAEIPNMNALLDRSIYSWSSLSQEHDESTSTGADLADIITGVNQQKHLVTGNNFNGNNFKTFPLVYNRITELKKDAVIKIYGSSSLFIENLAPESDAKLEVNDEGVVKGVLEGLTQPDITMVTGHFTEVDKAGMTGGYDNSNVNYKNAIQTFDKQVGEMVQALEKRPTYKKENWLIIITSSKGGAFEIPDNENDNTVFSNPNVNTFTIFYSPKYSSRYVNKPYLGSRFNGSFARFKDGLAAEIAEGDNHLFNLGDKDAEFTIELKVKKNKGPQNTYKFPDYPSFIGKRDVWESGSPGNGWVMFFKDDYWTFNAKGPNGSGEVNGSKLNNATWNNITVVGYINNDGNRMVKTYTNGIPGNEMDVTSWGALDNLAKFRLGLLNGGNNWNRGDFYIADVRFWKTALPQSVLTQYNCQIGVGEDHPYFYYMAANWPVEGSVNDNMIYDVGLFGNNLKLSNTNFEISKLNDFLCAPSVEILGSMVPKNTDITAQVFSWLQIPRQESWQLDGRVWVDK